MTLTKSLRLIAVVVLAILAGLILTMPAYAQEEGSEEGGEEVVETSEDDSSENNQEGESKSYTFTAQPGDSYTQIARKTTQIYGIENEINLSGEQIIFVETNLTIAAGSPQLNIGEEVSIEENLVREWVDKATNLSEAELSLWTRYANVADFNTDAVGQPAP